MGLFVFRKRKKKLVFIKGIGARYLPLPIGARLVRALNFP